jgi:hypothetical protein
VEVMEAFASGRHQGIALSSAGFDDVTDLFAEKVFGDDDEFCGVVKHR